MPPTLSQEGLDNSLKPFAQLPLSSLVRILRGVPYLEIDG